VILQVGSFVGVDREGVIGLEGEGHGGWYSVKMR
jgi:hypothetical protein